MGFIKAGFGIGAVALAGIAFTLSEGASLSAPDPRPGTTHDTPAVRVAERFRLILSGADTGCDVVKGDSVSLRKARLIFGADCADQLPDLANARFWAEQEDGSVQFVAEDGWVAIRFAVGDGLAYESYGAGAPLVSLIAEGD